MREAYPLGSAVGAHRSAGVLVVSRSRDYVNRPSQQSLAVREFLSEDSDVLFRAAFFDTSISGAAGRRGRFSVDRTAVIAFSNAVLAAFAFS